MPYAATTVAEAVDCLNRRYFLPAIQRPFVWSPEQVVALFDSLLKGYPISSFLFWAVEPQNRGNWQIYKFAENFKYGEVHTELAETDGRDVILVLDGQQRLTSLLLGLRGTFTVKGKGKRWDNAASWQRKRLYLDLFFDPRSQPDDESEEEQVEKLYGFEFFESPPASTNGRFWIRVGEVLNYPGEAAFESFKDGLMESLPETASRLDEKTARRTLDRLHRVVWQDEIISFYTEKDQDYDRVLGIFVRANDGGTKLSKSDLMLSMISSKWSDISAREEIYSFVDAINGRLDRRNSVTKDFVMKACLLLSGLSHVYQVKSFTNQNLETMRRNWGAIKVTLKRTFTLVNRFGIDRENLTSLNALLPIADYLHRVDVDLCEGTTPFHVKNAERIRRWLIAALLNRAFGGNSDEAIGVTRTAIESSWNDGKDFPIARLYEDLSRHRRRNVGYGEDSISQMLETRYGAKESFLLLSLMYEEKSWGRLSITSIMFFRGRRSAAVPSSPSISHRHGSMRSSRPATGSGTCSCYPPPTTCRRATAASSTGSNHEMLSSFGGISFPRIRSCGISGCSRNSWRPGRD
jgi:hypothetical protein